MKTKYIVVLIGQSVLILLFLVYGLAQRNQAEVTRSRSEISEKLVIESQMNAMQAQQIAQENEKRALIAQQEAMRQIELSQQHLAAALKAAEDCAKRK